MMEIGHRSYCRAIVERSAGIQTKLVEMKKSAIIIAAALLMIGCSNPSGTKHDLNEVSSKVRLGMNEVQVVSQAGVPTRIDVEGDYRYLRYDSKDGKGYFRVVLRNNVVIDTEMRD